MKSETNRLDKDENRKLDHHERELARLKNNPLRSFLNPYGISENTKDATQTSKS